MHDPKQATPEAPIDGGRDPDSIPYVYVLVRRDLDPVTQLVQASHAAHEAGSRFPVTSAGTHLVALGVRDELALERESIRLRAIGIEHHLFFEPDFGVGHSALATRPVFGAERRAFKGLQLLHHMPATKEPPQQETVQMAN